jgi:exopolyphosphatase / guanosine-5'-triphosphate,3'-diphosphate pyrophosphatase
MSKIIPRWEWRSFGTHFGDAEARLKMNGTGQLQHSHEIYILSSFSNANVKIRDGLMDIKQLEQTDIYKFELWRPVIKVVFPLPDAVIQATFAALNVVSPQEHVPITLDQFLAEVTSISGLHAIEVHKARSRFHLEDCMAELTEIVANGKTIRTIAVESENPASIAGTLRALGLEGIENVSYPRGLKRLLKI